MEGRPSDQIVLQRIRNRIMGYLEVASSFDEQRQYQANAPDGVSVPNEMMNQWEDWIPDRETFADFAPPVYSHEEQEALRSFHLIWADVAGITPNPLPPLEETLRLPQWELLRAAAESTLRVLEKRGFLPEEQEI